MSQSPDYLPDDVKPAIDRETVELAIIVVLGQ
jgi:hypothetical protein